jgi:phosphopantothenoylcysteine synthetase/decarboxylase
LSTLASIAARRAAGSPVPGPLVVQPAANTAMAANAATKTLLFIL